MENRTQPRQQAEDEEYTIDLLEIARVLWDKAVLLIVFLLIGAILAGVGTKFLITPQYKATSMVYIYSKTTSVTSLADLQIGTQLTVDFAVIAKTREVVESAIEKLGLDMTYEQVSNKITTANPSNSRILSITITDPDPVLACNLSNTLADELRSRIADVMNTDKPSMVERAVVPEKASSPSMTKNVAIGAMLGFVLAAGIVIVRYLLNDTIKSEEDVEKYLHLNVLAVVPVNHVGGKSGQKSGYYGSGR